MSRIQYACLSLAALLQGLYAALPAHAASAAQTENVTLSITAEEPAAPGAEIWVAVTQKVRPGWHTYWRNPGDSGLPTEIVWTLPPGVTAGPIHWPTPKRFDVGPLVNLGYSDEAILLVPLKIAADAAVDRPMPVRAAVSWLVCEEICIPEDAQVDLDLTAGKSDPQVFTRARAALPRSLPVQATAILSDGSIVITLPGLASASASAESAYFFPDAGDVVDTGPRPQVRAAGPDLKLTLQRAKSAKVPAQISGVADLGAAGAYEIPATAIRTQAPAAEDPNAAQGLLQAAMFAFFGGLILNLMPCVLPILSMKALSLAQSGGRRDELRRDGLFYLLGVVASFSAVAAVLLILKAGGEAVGWGFQLQSPPVVLALSLMMVAIGLNLFGLFEVPLSVAGIGQDLTRSGGGRGAFFTGVLAVLVASPCTAPFMGAALGFALTQSAVSAAAVFLCLGLGFAAPFTALAFSPALVGLIPRPGPWMVIFKELLAFPMFGTGIWLTWVLAQQTGPAGVVVALSAGLGMAFLCWFVPKLNAPWNWAAALIGLAGLAAAAAHLDSLPAPGLARAGQPGEFAPWSAEAVAGARAGGRPVFVDFTAAWCVTCQVNERVAFSSADTRAAFRAAGVVLLKADWTRRDAAITAELQRFGRVGVPLYLLYPPKSGAPVILPQILTPGLVADALAEISTAVPAG